MTKMKPLAFLSLLFSLGCLSVPEGASLDVELVLREVGSSVSRLEVELTAGDTQRTVERIPEGALQRVFFGDVPEGRVRLVVRSYGGDALLARTLRTEGVKGKDKLVFVLSLAEPPVSGCALEGATHDEEGLGCVKVLATIDSILAFRAGPVWEMADGAVLVGESPEDPSAPRRMLHVSAEGDIGVAVEDSLPELTRFSPDRKSALVSTKDALVQETALHLLNAGGNVVTLDAKANAGAYGFVGNDHVWVLESYKPGDWAALRFFDTETGEEVSSGEAFEGCVDEKVRGPLAGGEGDFLVFERAHGPRAFTSLVRLNGDDGSCESSPDDLKVETGSWGASPDGRTYAWREPMEEGGKIVVLRADEFESSHVERLSSHGGLTPTDAGVVFAQTQADSGAFVLRRYDREGGVFEMKLPSTATSALSLELRGEGESVSLALLDSNQNVYWLQAGKDTLSKVDAIAHWSMRRWLSDASLMLWELSTEPGAWYLPKESSLSPRRHSGVAPLAAQTRTLSNARSQSLVGNHNTLFDASSGSTVSTLSARGAWTLVGSGVALVEAASRQAVLLDSAGERQVIASEKAQGIGAGLSSTGVWIVYEDGRVASVVLPRGEL